MQPKLLRFLEQHEIMPIGETKPQKVDVRVLAATNADLEQRVAEGKFREDLYYRLSVIRIHVPPLRERREEIPHLSTFFLREALERLGKPDVQLSSEHARRVRAGTWWPGNVRQLKNEIQRAVALSAAGRVHRTGAPLAGNRHDAPACAASVTAADSRPARMTPRTWPSAIEQIERDMIQAALDRPAETSRKPLDALGLTRRGLYLKMRRLGLDTRAELDTYIVELELDTEYSVTTSGYLSIRLCTGNPVICTIL